MERIQIQNFKGPVLMNRRSEMGGVRVERMQYRRWGGDWAGWRQPPTQNLTGYPGNLKFPGRCDGYLLQFDPRSGTWQFGHDFCLLPGRRSPRLTVTWRGSWRGGSNPAGGARGGWRCCGVRGGKFISIKIAIWSRLHLVRQHIRLARSLWFAGHSRFAKSCNLFVELWFGFTFPFRSFLYLFVV